MHFHVITLMPEVCAEYTNAGVIGRAQQQTGRAKPTITVHYYNPREYTRDPHRKVDDRPYGGGPGMVMQAMPILRAWRHAVGKKADRARVKTLLMSPRGRRFTQRDAYEFAREYTHLVLISGRYEGVDQRVQHALDAEEISVGDFTLSGGELPALSILDATARVVPGVLGDPMSLEETRIASGELYTRPPHIRFAGQTLSVPEVLRSGDHAQIDAWRAERGQGSK